jgi:hypothetical protein
MALAALAAAIETPSSECTSFANLIIFGCGATVIRPQVRHRRALARRAT